MKTLQDIEGRAANYAAEKNGLDDLLSEISIEAEALRRKYTPRLRKVMNKVTAAYEDLYRDTAENPDLFVKPKTYIFEGIRVGFMAGKGSVQVEDEEQTISLIKKKLAEKTDQLIKVKEELVKGAIQQLSDDERKKIGAQIVGKENRVVITAVDTAINKILSSLIKVSVDELKEEYEEAA